MRRIFIAVFFLVFTMSQAQETPAKEAVAKTENYRLTKQESYNFNDQTFSFSPELNSIRVKKLVNNEEIDFGLLRRTTDDGLYIMTSTHTEDVSFGRFDSLGNFKTMRYDSRTDAVMEELYERKKDETRISMKK
ncbi:hypothetical protein [Salinimicrobium oceani]|uniref:Uncharacterized protein n=1 Tax=Salinimicrobium oceani TaxID=2722702 RepID=A0ABX1CYB7_9FLAO|nr:hypothetical protein [Salinimicrobium oceani]NJW53254.1 hypothetical protein [Salinimicrobium oceani]